MCCGATAGPRRRRTTSIRPCTSRGARSTRSAIEVREEVLQLAADVDVDRLELAAADARRARTPRRVPRRALALRRRAAAGEPLRRLGRGASRRAGRAGRGARRSCAAFGSADAARLPPLPADASSFVGRDRELAELKALLRGTRLLTLAGTGGVGKTRLALELARAAEPSYPGGAALVELAALDGRRGWSRARSRPRSTCARFPGSSCSTRWSNSSRRARCCWSWTTASICSPRRPGSWTRCCAPRPQLTILATSREPLRVPGEVVFRVPSLDIPDPEQTLEPRELLRYEAVRLFVERADAAAPASCSTRRTQRTLPASASASTACRSRSSSPPAAWGRSGPRRSPSGSTTASACSAARATRRRHASRRSRRRCSGATTCSKPDERTLFRRLGCVRRRLRSRGGRGRVRRRRARRSGHRRCARPPRREVARGRGRGLLPRAPLPPARDRSPVRPRAARRGGRDAPRWPSATPTGRLRWPRSSATRRGSTATPRTSASALDTLLERAPNDALRFCVALWPLWMRRIDLHEAQRRFEEALAAAPERTALRAEALLAAAAIDFRSGALSRGLPLAEESYRSPRRSAMRAPSGGRFSSWESSVSRATRPTSRCRGSSERSSSRSARASPPRRRSASTRSASLTGSSGIWPAPRSSWPGASSCSARSLARLSGSCPRSTSRRSGRASPAAGRGCAWCSRTRCSRSSRSPAMLPSATSLANQAGIVSARGDLARARALLDESAARFEDSGDERGKAAVLVRRAYLELAEGDARGGPRGSRAGARAATWAG